jgi:hypothetical protein
MTQWDSRHEAAEYENCATKYSIPWLIESWYQKHHKAGKTEEIHQEKIEISPSYTPQLMELFTMSLLTEE